MGRYYTGDIEGKFWFSVQSSDDADFFGVDGEARTLDYYYGEDTLPKVEEGIKDCKSSLGKNEKLLDDFFKDCDSYNDSMLVDYLNKITNQIHTEQGVKFFLEWYARLQLGKEIRDCIKEHGQCNFEAEI